MIERLILNFGIVFGILSFPTLFRKPSPKVWVPLYLISCLINYGFDKTLVETNQIKYPKRFLPKVFKINVIYDFLVCPFLSVWYSQTIYDSKISKKLLYLFLFSTPQGIYEVLLEKKTKTMQFKKNWKWYKSVFLVFVVKILDTIVLSLIKKIYEKNITNSTLN